MLFRYGSMNGHHEDKCLNMITILCSIVNMVFYLSREGGGGHGTGRI